MYGLFILVANVHGKALYLSHNAVVIFKHLVPGDMNRKPEILIGQSRSREQLLKFTWNVLEGFQLYWLHVLIRLVSKR